MSQDRTSTDFPGTSQTSGSGTSGQSGTMGYQSEPSSIGNGGTATGTAAALAQEYGGKISEAANQAKEFVNEKITVVGDKIKDLQNADFSAMKEDAKDYARKNPGQTILISAAAGLLLGLILRGRR